jgi:hypothetical protein
MKKRSSSISIAILVFALLLLQACKHDEPEILLPAPVDPITEIPDSVDIGNFRTANVMGVVRDESGNAIAGAVVFNGWGTEQTTTDNLGFFRFDNLPCYSQNAFVRIEKPGYFNGYRTWIPATSGRDRIELTLLRENEAGSFASADGATVQAEQVTLIFPPNAIALNGATYSGVVHVAINWIDPSNILDMQQQMPGNLTGRHDGAWKVLRSFGMLAVALTSDSGEELEIADGYRVEMHCELPVELQTDAPAQIPLWHFNESLGYWEFAGVADRTGNEYVASVDHFSYWNYDVEGASVNYTVTVNYAEIPIGYYPLDHAVLILTSPTIGQIPGVTGTNGEVSGLVPANEVMQLQVFLTNHL